MSQPGAPPEWRIVDDEFAWTELNPPPVDRRGQHTVPFRIFLVHVKTGPGTRHGADVTNHPLGFLRDTVPEMGIPPEGEDLRACCSGSTPRSRRSCSGGASSSR